MQNTPSVLHGEVCSGAPLSREFTCRAFKRTKVGEENLTLNTSVMPRSNTSEQPTARSLMSSAPSLKGMGSNEARTALESWIGEASENDDVCQRQQVANMVYKAAFPTESRVPVSPTRESFFVSR